MYIFKNVDNFIYNNKVIIKPTKLTIIPWDYLIPWTYWKFASCCKRIFLQLDFSNHDPNKYYMLNLVKFLIFF